MRKAHSPHGNVGPNSKDDFDSLLRQRCNVCDFCNGVDGRRQMTKDPLDVTGGFVCSKCKRSEGVVSYSQETEDWYSEAVQNSKNTVDGERDYDEIVEDLISTWEEFEDNS